MSPFLKSALAPTSEVLFRGSAPHSVKVVSGVSLSFTSGQVPSLQDRRFAPPYGKPTGGDYPPPNSTLTSLTPLSPAMPRQKTLRQAQRLLLERRRKQMTKEEKIKLELGVVVATPGAIAALEEAGESALGYIQRHASGDFA